MIGLVLGEIIAIRVLEKVLDKRLVAQGLANAATAQSNKGKNSKKTWTITNLDDPLSLPITGQYGAESYDETVGANYIEHNALGRKNPIIQFVNGNNDITNFTAVIYAKDLIALKTTLKLSIQNLKAWSKYDKKLKRPPIVSFKVADGEGNISYSKALIVGCNPKYMLHDAQGNLVHAEVALTIKEYVSYTQVTQSFDTRYHDVMDGEYHELIAAREYQNPMLGIAVRHYNEQSTLGTGDTVKLPDKQSDSISPILIKPKSITLTNYTDGSYDKYLTIKTDETPPHIRELINSKLEQRNAQYGSL